MTSNNSKRMIPEGYDPNNFPPFAVTADLVILTVRTGLLQVLLVRRREAPFAEHLALPGGFVGPEEELVDAAQRTLSRKTGVGVAPIHLEQLATYGDPDRDPRMRVVSVSYLAMAADLPDPQSNDDSGIAEWVDVVDLDRSTLAFDHAAILGDGLARARAKLEYTTLATVFCGLTFTIAELRGIYEAIWGAPLDPANFHRKVLASEGFVEPTGDSVKQPKGRPARVYRAGPAKLLSPPLTQ